MEIKSDLFYTKNDEWVRIEDGVATVGLTDYAQDALSDIVFVEITVDPGDTIEAEENIATVESIKAASDVYSGRGRSRRDQRRRLRRARNDQ